MTTKILKRLKFAGIAIMLRFKFLLAKRGEKNLVIVRTDEIGDYILFRNFLQEIRESEKFQSYKITLIGNKVWSELAEFLDSSFVDDFIWVDINDFWGSDFFKTFFSKLKNQRFDFLISPQTSRSWKADRICMMIPARNKISADATMENTSNFNRNLANYFYTHLITIPKNITQEFLKNRFFFEQLLAVKINTKAPSILADRWNLQKNGVTRYIVIVPGSSSLHRAWPATKFIEIIKFLLSVSDVNIILVGGKAEERLGQEILMGVTNGRIENCIGKTTLPELVKIIAAAAGIVSNETGAAHIGAALSTPTICLLGGGHFGRFMPYSEGCSSVNYVYETMDCYKCNWHCKFTVKENEAFPCVRDIDIERAKKAIFGTIFNGVLNKREMF